MLLCFEGQFTLAFYLLKQSLSFQQSYFKLFGSSLCCGRIQLIVTFLLVDFLECSKQIGFDGVKVILAILAPSLRFFLAAAVKIVGELFFVRRLDKLESALYAFEPGHFVLDGFHQFLTHL